MDIITLSSINKDKRYKHLDNCFISYSSDLKCLVASIENNSIILTDKNIDIICKYILKNGSKIYKYWNEKNNTNLTGSFLQIDIYS